MLKQQLNNFYFNQKRPHMRYGHQYHYSFDHVLRQISKLYLTLDKHSQIRVQQWTRKLCSQSEGCIPQWEKNKNMYAIALLEDIKNGRLQDPFNKMPSTQPLSDIRNYFRIFYMAKNRMRNKDRSHSYSKSPSTRENISDRSNERHQNYKGYRVASRSPNNNKVMKFINQNSDIHNSNNNYKCCNDLAQAQKEIKRLNLELENACYVIIDERKEKQEALRKLAYLERMQPPQKVISEVIKTFVNFLKIKFKEKEDHEVQRMIKILQKANDDQ